MHNQSKTFDILMFWPPPTSTIAHKNKLATWAAAEEINYGGRYVSKDKYKEIPKIIIKSR